MRLTIHLTLTVLLIICLIIIVQPATGKKPEWNGGFYPVALDGKTGSLVGRVTTPANGIVGQAYVAIVNASNVSEEYYNTTTDANGTYQILGVNVTYSSIQQIGSPGVGGNYTRGMNAYRIYASNGPYGEGFSGPFGIDVLDPAFTSVVISPPPARIELKAERSHLTADDEDNVKLTAFVYDAQGNPVAAGYKINFTTGSATRNNFTDDGNFDYVPGALGRLGSPDNSDNFYQDTTKNGSASVQFGWIDEFYSGNNSTIWAYSADNARVFASVKIYSAAPMDSLTGKVIDQSGAGLGGVNVTMHVMGYDITDRSYYEIYNMTRTTRDKPPHVGNFSFDYIVLTGAAYGYVDAEAHLTDNLTVSARSGNFSVNRSSMAIGNITLDTLPPNVTTPGPSPTPRPTPGFDAMLVLAGIAYLATRKKD